MVLTVELFLFILNNIFNALFISDLNNVLHCVNKR
jgi:hypothetical protein